MSLVFGMMEATVALLGTVVAIHIGTVSIATRSGIAGIPMRTGGAVVAELAAGQGDLLHFVLLFHVSFLLCNSDFIRSDSTSAPGKVRENALAGDDNGKK